MLKANRAVLWFVVLFLFWGCRPVPPAVVPPNPSRAAYVVIAADVQGEAVLCVEVTPLMQFLDPMLAGGALCGESIHALRERLRQQRRAQ